MSKWIDIKVKRPKEGVPVLCWWEWQDKPEGQQGVAVYQSGMWHEQENDENDYREPEFWRPLLPPPSRTV